MQFTRRDFLRIAGASAAAVGLTSLDLANLQEALANPAGPTVLWLSGASCTGCTVSLANLASTTAPVDVGDLLINTINLAYHPNLMAANGQTAVEAAAAAFYSGNYILAVEGGVPTAFGGNACYAWTYNNQDVTFQTAVTQLAKYAKAVLCVGTCASFGGIPAAGSNPAGVQSVKAATGVNTINIAGCPAHPNSVVYVVSQLLLGNAIPVDASGRPTALFTPTVHAACPRNGSNTASWLGASSGCFRSYGCRGPATHHLCPSQKWNNGVNWCISPTGAHPSIGCSESTFPGTAAFYNITPK